MMQRHRTARDYDQLLWDKVWEKALAASAGKNWTKAGIIKHISEETTDEDGKCVSESTLWRCVTGKLEFREDTRRRLLSYLAYDSLDQFKETLDKELPVNTTVVPPAVIAAPDMDGISSGNPYHYNIPIPPDYILGRERSLDEIHQKLTDVAQRRNVVLLSGIGGMGKTTLLHEYLNRDSCKSYFTYIVAVSVNRNLEDAFITAISNALNLDLSEQLAPDERLEVIIHRMNTLGSRNLLAIDNVNEADYNDLLKIKRTLVRTGWKVLVTTRTSPDEFEVIKVDELDAEDAFWLFVYHYASDSRLRNTNDLNNYLNNHKIRKEDIRNLLAHIARHTLLTELLAKSGNKKGISVVRLLELLIEQDSKHPELERIITIGAHADNTFRQELSKTTLHNYILSLFDTDYLVNGTGEQVVDAENEAKATMLRFFSVLPAGDIPIVHLKKLWRVDAADENTFEDRLDELSQIGWIQCKRKNTYPDLYAQNLHYKMHQLIQEVVYIRLKPDTDSCRPLIKTITGVFLRREDDHLAYQHYADVVIKKLKLLHLSKQAGEG